MDSRMAKQSFWQRDIISLIAYNYFFYSIVALYISYLPVYYSYQGISPSQIGVLLGVGPLISILSPPLWGYLSDKYKTVKKVLLLILVCAVVFGTIMFRATNFELLLLLVIGFNFFMSPIGPLTDGHTYRISESRKVSFGSIRLFGSIGFATTALLTGEIFDRTGISSISLVFVVYGVLAMITCMIIQDAPASTKPVSLKAFRQLFQNRRLLWFLLIVFILSVPHRINDGFLGIYIESLGGTTGLVGQAWFLATGSEAIVIGLSIRWLQSGKELQLIAAAAIFYCLRWMLCAFATDAKWVSYLQLFHGVTFAVYYLAAMQYIYKLIPSHFKATGQTIFGAIFFGFSAIIGSLIAGWIFEAYSGKILYMFMTGCTFIGLLLVLLTIWKTKNST